MQGINDFELSNLRVEIVATIFLASSKGNGIEEIPAKLLKNGVELLALLLRNIINLSTKLVFLPGKCKIALYMVKLKLLLKKVQRLILKLPSFFAFATSIFKQL